MAKAPLPKVVFSWVVALLIAAFAIYPALKYPIEEYTEDASWFHIYRGVVFSDAMSDGQLFPRWVQPINAGLGGPLFTFYAPLVYYLMHGLYLVGLPHTLAWRVVWAAALLAGAAGMFLLALSLFKRASIALVCSACFTYAPHLLIDIFERGSPQALAVVLYPWMLWSLLWLARQPDGRRFAASSVCWALMLLSHTATALWLLPVLGIVLLFIFLRDGKTASGVCLSALAAGSLLAAFFLLPFVADHRYVQWDNNHKALFTQPVLNPVSLATLFAPPTVFDTGGAANAMGRPLGWLHAFLLAAGLPLAFALAQRRRLADALLVASLSISSILSVWLQTSWGTLVWSAIPMLSILEFRWRLQTTVGLSAALIAGYALSSWRPLAKGMVVGALIVLCVALEVPSLYPQLLRHRIEFSPRPTVAEAKGHAIKNAPGLSAFDEEQPVWRTLPFTPEEAERVAASPVASLPEGTSVVSAERHAARWRIRVSGPVAFSAALHILYFPGWVGYVDGARTVVRPMEGTGYMLIDVPEGTHTIDLAYEGTLAQHVGDIASALTAAGLVVMALLWRRPRKAGTPPQGGGEAANAEPAVNYTLSSACPDEEDRVTYLQPRWWVIPLLLALVGLKAFWIDPHTTWFRRSSTCQATYGAQVQTDVWFGDDIHLCAYSVSKRWVNAGDTITVTLFWQARQPLQDQFNSFLFLVGTQRNPGTGDTTWARQDKGIPGSQWMSQWEPGKLYRDTYDLTIPDDTPPGEYRLEFGLWHPVRQQRAPVRIADSRVPCSDSFSVPGIAVGAPPSDMPIRYVLGMPLLRDSQALSDPILQQVQGQATRDDVVICDVPIARYLRGQAVFADVDVRDPARVRTQLAHLVARRRRVWLISWTGADPLHVVPDWLDTHLLLLQRQQAARCTVSAYLVPGTVSPPADRAVDIKFGGGLRLVHVELDQAQVQYREKIALTLRWQPQAVLPGNVMVSLRLVDGQGRAWAQTDTELYDSRWGRASAWHPGRETSSVYLVPVPAGVVPGLYDLKAVLYMWGSQQVLSAVDPTGQAAGEEVGLAQVRIVPAQVPPDITALQIPHPSPQPLVGGLEMLGYDIGGPTARVGEAAPLTVWWRSTGPVEADYRARLTVVDSSGSTAADRVVDLASAEYPTSRWVAGEVIEGRYVLPIAAEAHGGKASVTVELVGPQGLAGQPVSVGSIEIVAPQRVFTVPSPQYPRAETLGAKARLLGYDLSSAHLHPGETLDLTLYWQALAPFDTGYTVFVHFLDRSGQVRVVCDNVPAAGNRPTTGWLPGEVVADEHAIPISPGISAGEYAIEVGLYEAQGGSRLPVYDAQGARAEQDRILLSGITVE